MSRAASALRAHRAVRHGSRPCSSSAAAEEAWDDGPPPLLRLEKHRGQHLLANPRVLDDIARRAAIRPGDRVLEVGPGTGNLTARLLASPAAHVAAVEIDRRMAGAVAARAAGLGLAHKLTVTTGDAMEVEFPEFDVCVSNIPYGISSPLVAKLLFGPYRFRAATLLVQKEFARRLAGAPGHGVRNHLATNARLVADVRVLADVSRREFVPAPMVDSSLVGVRMKEARPREAAPGVGLDEWLAFTRVCFGQHRVQLQQHRRKKKKKKEKTLGTLFRQEEMAMELFRLSRRSAAEERDGNAGSGGGRSALNGDDNNAAVDDDANGGDRCDDGAGPFGREEVVAFKERIAGALQSARLANERPSTLSNDDLLRLFRVFVHRGVRFC